MPGESQAKAIAELAGGISEKDAEGGLFVIRSGLPAFSQSALPRAKKRLIDVGTSSKKKKEERTEWVIKGRVNSLDGAELFCPKCHCAMVKNGTCDVRLAHLPIGADYQSLAVSRQRYVCPACGASLDQGIPFKAKGHMMTEQLRAFAESLLAAGLSLKEVSIATGLHKDVVKGIDLARLSSLYVETREGRKALKGPDRATRLLGVDEFLLHRRHRFATIFVDLETGAVLYLAYGKKKRCVSDFIKWMGEERMGRIEAVACDMNSDYEEEFRDRCPGIAVVFDRFHVVKNFNDKVISEVRKDEERRLRSEGKIGEAAILKGSKYILMMSSEARKAAPDAGKSAGAGGDEGLFGPKEAKPKGDAESRYWEIVESNELLFVCDYVKEALKEAYDSRDESDMEGIIAAIVETCLGTGNKHFEWFAKMLVSHIDGILAHASFPISTGKVEGLNQMTKTLRRRSYGFRDDEYFFLKIIDASRRLI